MKSTCAHPRTLSALTVAGLVAASMLSACAQAPSAPPEAQASQAPAASQAAETSHAPQASPAPPSPAATAAAPQATPLKAPEVSPVKLPGQKVEVPPPPFTDGVYPCSFCHNADLPPNRTRRELMQMHGDLVLVHDSTGRIWCVDCHDSTDYDSLHLAGGEKVLIIDDFLATGSTILGLVRLAQTAGAEIVGIGTLIEKSFEGGRDVLAPLNIPVESLVCIDSMDGGQIIFGDCE